MYSVGERVFYVTKMMETENGLREARSQTGIIRLVLRSKATGEICYKIRSEVVPESRITCRFSSLA